MSISVQVGALTFPESQIVSVTGRQTVDPIYGGLPEGEMVVQLYTTQPLSPQREEKMTLLVDGFTALSMFVKKCTCTGSHRYKLQAGLRTEYLQTRFIGKIYQGEQVYTQMQEIFGEQADRFDIEQIAWDTMIGYIPPGTRGQALQQLCFGSGAIVTCGTSGDLCFKKPLGEEAKVLINADLTAKRTQVLLPHYTRFELASHNYVKGQVEKVLIDREEYSQSQVVIPFQNPHWYYNSDTEYTSEILDYGSNFVEVTHPPGPLVIYGKPWLDQREYHTLPGVESDDPWFSHVLTVRDRTLIGPHNVQARLQELKTLGQMRQKLTVGCLDEDLLDGPRPGDPVKLPDVRGIVTGERLSLTAGRVYRELTVLCEEDK